MAVRSRVSELSKKSNCNTGRRNVSKGTRCAYISSRKSAHGFQTRISLRNKQKTMSGNVSKINGSVW